MLLIDYQQMQHLSCRHFFIPKCPCKILCTQFFDIPNDLTISCTFNLRSSITISLIFSMICLDVTSTGGLGHSTSFVHHMATSKISEPLVNCSNQWSRLSVMFIHFDFSFLCDSAFQKIMF